MTLHLQLLTPVRREAELVHWVTVVQELRKANHAGAAKH